MFFIAASVNSMKCKIFKTNKRDEMYLYVKENMEYESLPESLRQLFGPAIEVMELVLSRDRQLAREDVNQVIDKLEMDGFYLQLPPSIINIPGFK